MPARNKITAVDAPEMEQFCAELRASESNGDQWPRQQLAACTRLGVFEWFVEPEFGGQGWSAEQIARGYLRLSAACMTTAFVLTQITGATRRIASSDHNELKLSLLPRMATGDVLGTLGISHLTTSRQHLGRPVLLASEQPDGFRLEGFSPWVTGSEEADYFVIAAVTEDGRQVMLVVPHDLPGVRVGNCASLVALSGSRTGPVHFDGAVVPHRWILDGPRENVMQLGTGARTGGLQTSALALGLARAAIDYVHHESKARRDLSDPYQKLDQEWQLLADDLLDQTAGREAGNPSDLRGGANRLVLRATQAALVSAKGAGYVQGHPVGRWCREALFFLVWSCPQPVSDAHLCELAGISS